MATSVDMGRVKKILTGCSFIFIILLFLLIRIGPQGLIYANIINVTLRIILNGTFTFTLLEKEERIQVIKGFIPDSKVIAAFIATISGGFYMKFNYEVYYNDSTPILSILTNKFFMTSIAFGGLILVVILFENRGLVKQILKKGKTD
jgi:hypothetical protein